MKNVDWDDLRCFLIVAQSGGLTAGLEQSGLSAATLSRRMKRLEDAIGRPLFSRAQTGYSLTADGADLLERARGMEAAARSLSAWASEVSSQSVVRIAAGTWMTRLVCQNFPAVNPEPARIRIVFETGERRANMAYREADIGIRAFRPTETYLAARRMSLVAYALYCRRNAGPDERARMVAVREEEAISAYLKWPHQNRADVIGVLVNRPGSLVDLARAGAGSAVLPCFVGDLDPELERIGEPIATLAHEQWLVVNNEDRHRRDIRQVSDRLATLLARYSDVFEGRRPSRSG